MVDGHDKAVPRNLRSFGSVPSSLEKRKTARSKGVEVRITPGEGRVVLVHDRMIVGPALDQETLLSPPSVANGIDNPASR